MKSYRIYGERWIWFVPLLFLTAAGMERADRSCSPQWRKQIEKQIHTGPDLTRELYNKHRQCPFWHGGEEFLSDKQESLRKALETVSHEFGFPDKPTFQCKNLSSAEKDVCLSELWTEWAWQVATGTDRGQDHWIDLPTQGSQKAKGRTQTEDFRKVLSALTNGDFAGTVEELLPDFPDFIALRRSLERYRQVKGPFPVLKGLLRNPSPQQFRQLADRLQREDYWHGNLANVQSLTPPLKEALKRFQENHSLEADGVLGPKTVEALNTSLNSKVARIQSTLRRMLRLPPLTDEHLLVDIAGFQLEWREGQQTLLRSPIVIGKADWATPQLSERLTYLVANPQWRVPDSIAREEILPKLSDGLAFLHEEKFQVLHKHSNTPLTDEELEDQDWEEMKEPNAPVPLRFVQLAGPNNPLGRVKFMFPNPLAIYVHDTPNNQLFQVPQRTFSHGCIRLKKARELAVLLLERHGKPNSVAEFRSALETETTKDFPMETDLPVHLVYWTTRAVEDGRVEFRKDVYDREENQANEGVRRLAE